MSRKLSLFLFLFWMASPAAAGEPLPIWLNEDFFGIARIEDFERRLRRPFPVEGGPYYLKGPNLPRWTLMNCATFWRPTPPARSGETWSMPTRKGAGCSRSAMA